MAYQSKFTYLWLLFMKILGKLFLQEWVCWERQAKKWEPKSESETIRDENLPLSGRK